VAFDVGADAYDRFMGRYSVPMAPGLADLAGIERGRRVLDVGCGPGALTAELVQRLGPDAVVAVDPSEPFVTAARERNPGVDVQLAAAEELPFEDDAFDAALAQLVVHFMADAVTGLREMARVTRPGGVVAASVWGPEGPLSTFWRAVREREPGARDESALAGAREGHLAELFEQAGLRDVEPTVLEVRVEHPTFDEWWQPFTGGVGPSGAYVASLDPAGREELRERCRELVPPEPFTVTARAWAVRGRA
jgi:ubiquinone/menaquinone biosynthesis C-methylase UbiE